MLPLAHLAAGLLSLATLAAMPATATPFTLFAETSADATVDVNFNDRCGGSDNFDCEFTVAQGVAGNRAPNGNVESQIFDRLANTATSAQTQNYSETSTFTLSFDADGGAGSLGRLFLDAVNAPQIFDDYDFGAGPGGANPAGPAESLVLRVARASLTNLFLNGMPLPDLMALPTSRSYLYVGGFDLTADWILEGTLETNPALNNSATGFQIKVTDLEVPGAPPPSGVIPLPAGLPLMLAGLGAMGGARVLRRR